MLPNVYYALEVCTFLLWKSMYILVCSKTVCTHCDVLMRNKSGGCLDQRFNFFIPGPT